WSPGPLDGWSRLLQPARGAWDAGGGEVLLLLSCLADDRGTLSSGELPVVGRAYSDSDDEPGEVLGSLSSCSAFGESSSSAGSSKPSSSVTSSMVRFCASFQVNSGNPLRRLAIRAIAASARPLGRSSSFRAATG